MTHFEDPDLEAWRQQVRDNITAQTANRWPRRRRRPVHLAAAVVVAVIAFAATTALFGAGRYGDNPAWADITVEETGDAIVIKIDGTVDANDVMAATAHLTQVHVSPVATGPSKQGTFVGLIHDGDPAANSYTARELRVHSETQAQVLFGRPAGGDETYKVLTDAVAAGEPLACLPLVGRAVHEVRGLLDQVTDVELTWTQVQQERHNWHSHGPHDDLVIHSAFSDRTNHATLVVGPPSTTSADTAADGC